MPFRHFLQAGRNFALFFQARTFLWNRRAFFGIGVTFSRPSPKAHYTRLVIARGLAPPLLSAPPLSVPPSGRKPLSDYANIFISSG